MRLIDRPRPVPPYWRAVEPSACANASNIAVCRSSLMPIPVSADADRDDGARLARRCSDGLQPPVPSSMRTATSPRSVNLKALDEEVLEHLPQAMRIGRDRRRQRVVEVDGEREALVVRERLERLEHGVAQLGERELGDLDVDRVRLDLGEVEDVVEEREEVHARGADDVRVLDLALREVPVGVVLELLGQHQQAVERRAQLVGHVRDELRLVLRGDRQLASPSPRRSASPPPPPGTCPPPRCSSPPAGSPARRAPRWTGAAAPGGDCSSCACEQGLLEQLVGHRRRRRRC